MVDNSQQVHAVESIVQDTENVNTLKIANELKHSNIDYRDKLSSSPDFIFFPFKDIVA